MKSSLDIFYFAVPYSLSDVLEESGPIHKELFRQQWQTLGEAKQVKPQKRMHACMYACMQACMHALYLHATYACMRLAALGLVVDLYSFRRFYFGVYVQGSVWCMCMHAIVCFYIFVY